jgi:hypothetical protein
MFALALQLGGRPDGGVSDHDVRDPDENGS